MELGMRIKKVRELRQLNQKMIAAKMNITAQTYSTLEEGDNLKYSAIKKFCDAVNVEPAFLLADELPVTEETIHLFDRIKGKSLLLLHEQLRQKIEVYSDVLKLER
jgi:transcriptional regulator with XRE-family HTH domain